MGLQASITKSEPDLQPYFAGGEPPRRISDFFVTNEERDFRGQSLLTGPLEPTNQWYAVAKIAGIKMCQAYRRQYGCDFISAMPTNMYGPNDDCAPRISCPESRCQGIVTSITYWPHQI